MVVASGRLIDRGTGPIRIGLPPKVDVESRILDGGLAERCSLQSHDRNRNLQCRGELESPLGTNYRTVTRGIARAFGKCRIPSLSLPDFASLLAVLAAGGRLAAVDQWAFASPKGAYF